MNVYMCEISHDFCMIAQVDILPSHGKMVIVARRIFPSPCKIEMQLVHKTSSPLHAHVKKCEGGKGEKTLPCLLSVTVMQRGEWH